MVYFSNGKYKAKKRNKQFISPIKNLCANVLFNMLSMFQVISSLILLSMILLSKKPFKKKKLTNTCINKDVFICVNKLLNAHVQIGD